MGLAETNSRFTFSPAKASLRPYAAPAATTSAATRPWAPASTVMLRNPGPATSTRPTPAAVPSSSARTDASSRGSANPARLLSCRATLVA